MSELKLTVTSWGTVELDKRELRKVMRAAGNDIRSKTQRIINSSQGSGRRYYGPAGPYRASAPGLPPARVTGALRASLRAYVYKSGEGFAVRAREFYSLFLETGAKGGGNRFGGRPKAAAAHRSRERHRRAKGMFLTRLLEPRPFLDRVMQREASELNRRVGQALTRGLTWKQTKSPS